MIFVGEVCPFSSGSWDSSEITGKNQAPDTGHGLALVSMNNSGLRKKTLNDKIKALAEHLGKDPTNYHAHSLRATAACNKYHETNDLLLVKAFLGHRQVAMTEQYTGNLNVIG